MIASGFTPPGRSGSATGSTPIQRVRQQNLTQNVVEFQNYSQCVDALRGGQVDAVTTDNAILQGYAAQSPDQLRVVGVTFSEEPYGIGMNRDDVALRNKVNDLLQASESDGTWTRLYNETLGRSGTPAPQPPPAPAAALPVSRDDRRETIPAAALLALLVGFAVRLGMQPAAPPRRLGGGAGLRAGPVEGVLTGAAPPGAEQVRGVGRFRGVRTTRPVRL